MLVFCFEVSILFYNFAAVFVIITLNNYHKIMKKILHLSCLLTFLATSLTANALYINGANGIRYQTNSDNTEVTIVKPKSGNTYAGDYEIPATVTSKTYGELPVVAVGESAFANCDMLTSVILPESVTKIGDYAFDTCEKLVTLEMPGVKEIGHWSFRYCEALENLVFPEGLESIGNYSFDHNSKLEVIDLPSTMTNLGGYVFEGNPQITRVICRAVEPPAIKKGYIDGEEIYTIFEDDDYGDIELVVPDESVTAYRTTLGWHYFNKITPLNEYLAGIGDIAVDVTEEEGKAVYYDICGREVAKPVTGNFYIKKTGSKVTKVVF